MNEDRLYFAQQPQHWLGAEEEIVSREDMLQDSTMATYEDQNQLVNNFWNAYACEPNNNNPNYNLQPHEAFARAQEEIAPKMNYYTNYKYDAGYERSTYQGKSPLLKKMLQAPTGVNLEDIARTDIYVPTWPHQYPQQDFNDNNSDTLTADSEGEFDWETYRGYVMPNNIYYQNSVNAQESCTNWINNLNNNLNNNTMADVKQAYDNSMMFYNNQAILEQAERQAQNQAMESQMLSTNAPDNQYSFYYSQDAPQQNVDYYNQNGNTEEAFVMSSQETQMNLNDYEQFEFKPFANDSITYAVLQDKNENVESELISVPMQAVNESANQDDMQSYWPRWRSNVNNKPLNLEILLNVRSKSNVNDSRDELGRVVFCCQTPVLSDKVDAQNSSSQFTNGQAVENRQHNFSTYPLVYQSVESPDDRCAQMCKTMKVENTTDETGVDGSLKQTDGYSYYIVQDYQECTIEAETESNKMQVSN